MTAGITRPFKFLGCTVSQINSTFGINGQPTTVDVRLVEDLLSGDRFLADNYVTPTDFNQEGSSIKTAIGGSYFLDGNPGFFTTLKVHRLSFGGIVTSYKRSGSTSGRFIDVQLSDPRILLKEYPVVMEFDIKLYTDQTQGSTWDFNVFNPLRNSNPLNEDITSDGIRFIKIRTGIEALTLEFFGVSYKIKFDTSFNKEIGGNYRIPLQNTNIEQVISRTAEDNTMDWYAECLTDTGNAKQITVYGISRKNQYLSSSSALVDFIGNQTNIINYEIGRELRTDASQTVVYGDKVRTLSLITPINVFPVFAERADGSFSDDGFVDLSGIVSTNTDLLAGLPTFSIKQNKNTKVVGSLVNSSDQQASYFTNPTYKKNRSDSSRRGYFINEFIARAALHSKAAWATAVWYFYKDGGVLAYHNRSSFDVSWTANSITQTSIDGNSSVATYNYSNTNLPEKLGIMAPDFDRDNLTFTNLAITSTSSTANPWTEALKEACYQATLVLADSYYGKVFIGRLDHSSTIAGLVSSSSGQYSYSLKALPMEFGITNAAPNIRNINGDIQQLPNIMFNNQNSSFNEDNGLIKPFILTRVDTLLLSYDRVDISHFDSATTLNLPSWNSESEVSYENTVNLCNSGISIGSYKYDPRFVVVAVNEPVYLDYGLIRWFRYSLTDRYTIEDSEVNNNTGGNALIGQIKTILLPGSNYLANPYSASNKSGGTQEFFSWLYKDYMIVYNVSSAILVNGSYVDIDPVSKKITASKYDEVMSILSDVHKDHVGFAQRRDINAVGSINIYVPLVWNYVKYGPFTSVANTVKNVPTQFIEDSSINPWSYGNLTIMKTAGNIIAENATSASRTLGYASVSVSGLPEHQLGKLIASGNANVANISEISISVGTSGATTSYRLRTFFGGSGIRKKTEIDKISRTYNSSKELRTIKLDDIAHGLVPKGLKLSSFPKPKVSDINVFSSNTVITSSGRASNSGKSSISIVTDNAPKLSDENGAGTNQMVAFSNLSELFQPVTAKAPITNHLIAPTIQGVRIT